MRRRILIVEDDEAVLETVELMLGKDYEIMKATDGWEAVKLYKVFNPDIVLMDIVMPRMDGVEATREILKIDPEAKIIGVTAYASRKGKELIEAGAKEIVEKPFTRSELVGTIEKYLDDHDAD